MISPVRVVRRVPKNPKLAWMRVYAWTCDEDRLRAAKLQSRDRPEQTVIVHPSTKREGKWQATWFNAGVPEGDFQAETCTEALREYPPTRWRLRQVRVRQG